MGENVFRQIRTYLGLTQVKVADQLGLTQAAVSKIEKREQPDFLMVQRLAEANGYEARVEVRKKDPSVE